MSTHRTRWPSSTKAAARLSVVVVFATPPFWLAKAMTLAWPVTARLLGSGGRTIGPRFAPARRSPAAASTMGRMVSPARQDARSSHLPSATYTTGLAHVATVSFLASRAAPSLQFFFALGGGIALARVGAAARRAHRLRRRARVDAADRRGDGPRADQRAAHAGDHRADDGPAAGARRPAADRVPRLPRAAARPLRGAARRVHLRDPRRAGRVHRLLRDARPAGSGSCRRAPRRRSP